MRLALAGAVLVAIAACSPPSEVATPPESENEERALAEARAMIPASEITPAPGAGQ